MDKRYCNTVPPPPPPENSELRSRAMNLCTQLQQTGVLVRRLKSAHSVDSKYFYLTDDCAALEYKPTNKSQRQLLLFSDLCEVGKERVIAKTLKGAKLNSYTSFIINLRTRNSDEWRLVFDNGKEANSWLAFLGLVLSDQMPHIELPNEDTLSGRIKAMWNRADLDHDGKLTLKEVKKLLIRINVNVRERSLREMFNRFDASGDGTLDLDEFTALYMHLINRPELRCIFDEFAKYHHDYMTETEFVQFYCTHQILLIEFEEKQEHEKEYEQEMENKEQQYQQQQQQQIQEEGNYIIEATQFPQENDEQEIQKEELTEVEKNNAETENTSLRMKEEENEMKKRSEYMKRNEEAARKLFAAHALSTTTTSSSSSSTTPNQGKKEKLMSFDEFAEYLINPVSNSAIAEPHRFDVVDDMTLPIHDYFIYSSHNTYLTGDQFKSASSTDMYKMALLAGVRCVELDCWDGSHGEPVIYHGHTYTSKVSVRDVLQTIKQFAFEASPYPVILSLEIHTSVTQSKRLAEHLQEVFGEMLCVAKDVTNNDWSPHALQRRILVKWKLSGESYSPTDTSIIYPSTSNSNYCAADGENNESDNDDDNDLGNKKNKMANTSTQVEDSNNNSPDADDSLSCNSSITSESFEFEVGSKSNAYNVDGSCFEETEDEFCGNQDSNDDNKQTQRCAKVQEKESENIERNEINRVPVFSAVEIHNYREHKEITTLPSATCYSSTMVTDTNTMIHANTLEKTEEATTATTTTNPCTDAKEAVELKPSESSSLIAASPSLEALSISNIPSNSPCEELSACVALGIFKTSCHGADARTNHVQSYTEAVVRAMAHHPTEKLKFMMQNSRMCARVYPKGTRLFSSNYNPTVAWSVGAQMVALNVQTWDSAMRLNDGFFTKNGHCGYALKPQFLRARNFPSSSADDAGAATVSESLTASPSSNNIITEANQSANTDVTINTNADLQTVPSTSIFTCSDYSKSKGLNVESTWYTLTIRVICGSQLPKPKLHRSGDIVNPFVKLRINGEGKPEWHTRCVKNNGLTPYWDETFVIHGSCFELDVLTLRVMSENRGTGGDNEICEADIPVNILASGYRAVEMKLCKNGAKLNATCVLCHFKFDTFEEM